MGVLLRVLIVEDSEDDAELMLRELQRGGYELVFQRVDTPAAMEAALASQPWDVVIADHAMPRFNALAALHLLQESGLDLPFIIVSGSIGEDIAVEAMKAGAHDYIMKNSLARLVPAIERELREAVVRRERRKADEALRKAHEELEVRVEQRTAELARANEELRFEIAQRKRAEQFREEYVALISHDLRNPLASLMGYAQLLHRSLVQRGLEREVANAEIVLDNARRMNAMIQELVETAHLESGRLEVRKELIDLPQLVYDIVERLSVTDDRSRIRVGAVERVPAVPADPNRIERAIVNLLTNALKYSPSDRPVVVRIRRRGDEVLIAVADQGVGISPEDVPHLFERFSRGTSGRRTEGLGLGLYIVRLIVEAHGGHIWVESELGKGSTFYVTLPLTQRET